MQPARLLCQASCLTTNLLLLFSSIGTYGILKTRTQNLPFARVSEWNHWSPWQVASALLIADMQLALNDRRSMQNEENTHPRAPGVCDSLWFVCVHGLLMQPCLLACRLTHPWQWAFTALHTPPPASICWRSGQTGTINNALPQGKRTLSEYRLRHCEWRQLTMSRAKFRTLPSATPFSLYLIVIYSY